MTMTVWQTENRRFQLRVASLGGEVCSLWDKQHQREWFWQNRQGVWNNSATQLFPVVGRLIHDGLWQGERFYPLPAHGFLRHQRFHLTDAPPDRLVLEASATPETLAVWPWKWRCSVQCELTGDGMTFSQTLFNEDVTPFWFSSGWHPGFALPVADEPGWEIRFGGEQVTGPWPTQDRTLYVSKNAEQTGTFLLTETSFSHGAVYFGDCQNRSIRVCSPQGKTVLEMETGEQEWLALWGVPGADLLCMEPLSGTTDAPDFSGQVSEKRGMQQLAPGQRRTFTSRLRFPLDA